MGWLGGLVVHKSQVRTRYVYGYRVHLEAGQNSAKHEATTSCIQHGQQRGDGCVGFARAEKTESRQGAQSEGAGRSFSWEVQKQQGKTGSE